MRSTSLLFLLIGALALINAAALVGGITWSQALRAEHVLTSLLAVPFFSTLYLLTALFIWSLDGKHSLRNLRGVASVLLLATALAGLAREILGLMGR